MPSYPEHDDDPQHDRRKHRLAILVVAIILLFVLLHLTGILGPGSH